MLGIMVNKEKLRHCVVIYNNWISENVDAPAQKALRVRPKELESIFRDLKDHMNSISSDQVIIDSLDDTYRSYLKSAILHALHTQKEDSKKRSQLTTNPEIKKQLTHKVEQILELTEGEWFERTDAFNTPKLEDFLAPQKKEPTHIIDIIEDNVKVSWVSRHSPSLIGAAAIIIAALITGMFMFASKDTGGNKNTVINPVKSIEKEGNISEENTHKKDLHDSKNLSVPYTKNNTFTLNSYKEVYKFAYSASGMNQTTTNAKKFSDLWFSKCGIGGFDAFKEIYLYAYSALGMNMTSAKAKEWAMSKTSCLNK